MKFDTLAKADIKGKNVLLRVDYNVPIKDGKIADEKRISATVKTVKHLLDNNCRIVIISHLGRPKGKVVPEMSLKPVVPAVERLMEAKVHFGGDCVGEAADKAVASAKKGEIVLLENLRFHKEETDNDDNFAKALSKHGEIFVQDAFGAVHRAHASTAAIAKFLPAVIGFLVEKELDFLDKAVNDPAKPFLAILGGAKVSDKIAVITNLLDKVDMLIVGGAMAYTFLRGQSVTTGNSLVEEDKIQNAKDIISKAYAKRVEMLLPSDHIITEEIKQGAAVSATQAMAIPAGKIGADIGPRSIAMFTDVIKKARTIFWNGPVGVFEVPEFSAGTIAVAKAMAEATAQGAMTIIGGGDSLSAIKKAGFSDKDFSHCSTGGGASMEFLEGKELPGLKAICKN